MEKLLADLQAAMDEFKDAEQAESLARSRSTDARNKLNEAQRAFDKAISELKEGAPRDSDWWCSRHERQVGGFGVVVNKNGSTRAA